MSLWIGYWTWNCIWKDLPFSRHLLCSITLQVALVAPWLTQSPTTINELWVIRVILSCAFVRDFCFSLFSLCFSTRSCLWFFLCKGRYIRSFIDSDTLSFSSLVVSLLFDRLFVGWPNWHHALMTRLHWPFPSFLFIPPSPFSLFLPASFPPVNVIEWWRIWLAHD